MRAELQRAQSQPQSGGFLSSIFGGGSKQPVPQPQRPAGSPWGGQGQPHPGYAQPGPGYGPQGGYAPGPQGGPWGGQQPGMMAGGGGGGFLRSALTTAAGVAGGMVVGNALMNAFRGGHESLGAFSPAQASALGGDTDVSSLSPFSDTGGGAAGFAPDAGGAFDTGGGYQDASFDPGDDMGGDSGGGDDWT